MPKDASDPGNSHHCSLLHATLGLCEVGSWAKDDKDEDEHGVTFFLKKQYPCWSHIKM